MPKHKVYVTRDASVTYVAEVDMPLEEIKKRCGKHGFDDEGLDLDWSEGDISAYDNVEAYHVTHEVRRVVDNATVIDEITDLEWDMD